MTSSPDLAVRRATDADAEAIGRLLHDFNREFDEPTPGPPALAERIGELIAQGETEVLLGGPGPDDTAARALYESLRFSNREGKPDGPINYYYEREL